MDIDQASERIRRAGWKVTPQRQRILEILAASPGPLSAREVLARVRQVFPGVSLDTVYRNLGMLTEIGMASQLNLRNRETARFEFQGHHHHHLVCLDCGQSECVADCPMTRYDFAEARSRRFTVVDHAFEIYGYCAACSARSRDNVLAGEGRGAGRRLGSP